MNEEYVWKDVGVVGFDELMQALERADRKGYMPDAVKEAWEGFNWKPAQQQEPVQNEQAAFEAWASERLGFGTADKPVDYARGATRDAWEVWKARAALTTPTQPKDMDGPKGSGGWQYYAEAMERERDYYRQRVQTIHDHKNGDCWYWQGDGEDFLESMVNSLPVVIRAGQLRALLTSPPAQRKPLTDEEIDRALDAAKVPELPGGYESVELEIARAIEAAIRARGNT